MTDVNESWPAFDYREFQSTGYLLHRIIQIMGKLKLLTPFEPHWSNVALWLTSRGLTTSLIPYQSSSFSIDLDMIDHQITVTTSAGLSDRLSLTSMSVADFTQSFFSLLHGLQIDIKIHLMPQEVANPIAFDKDTTERLYQKELAHTWWRILLTSYHVMQKHHAHFNGETPPIGLMWGTFDLRDARYNGRHIPTEGINAGYIRRNAMNEEQVEIGWWPGNEAYPRPAYFSFIYPKPDGIENSQIMPAQAHWNPDLMEFVLDYDETRKSDQPEKDLLDFFESTYQAGAQLAGWNPELVNSGVPDKPA